MNMKIGNKPQTITELLRDFGIYSTLVKTDINPTKTTYHLDLFDITKLSSINRIIKYLSAYLHKEVTYLSSKIAHFCLSMPNDKVKPINYNDKKIQDAINSCEDLSLLIGVDSQNKPTLVKLDELPHLLIAGTTGSGKSVLLNNIICSLIQQSDKHNIELALIDPKQVELCQYEGTKAVSVSATNPAECINVLKVANSIIDERYAYMRKMKLKKADKSCKKVIVIIDEFADLMILAKSQVENLIIRIAQLGRACGVHLIIATQRPSADVITGLIKSNIPSRIALKTTSYRDSMIILDSKGAENLYGKGDALLKLPTECELKNIQCPYIDDEMINNIIN